MLLVRTLCLLLMALLNDQLVKSQFLGCSFFYAVFRDEAEHVYLLRLTNTMGAVHSLKVRLRIPGKCGQ
jgi:hypothetical protein